MKIEYEIYHYNDTAINNKIIALYKKVFHIDFSVDFGWWYHDNPYGRSIGVIALFNGEVVGHTTATPLPFNIGGDLQIQLISLGTMVDSKYQGMGIFGKMSITLYNYLINNSGYAFIIGFPNNNSLHAFIKYLDWRHIRDYRFVDLPQKVSTSAHAYRLIDLSQIESLLQGKNGFVSLNRTYVYWKWRLRNSKKYGIAVDKEKNEYVFTQYGDKIDILAWSYDASEDDLLDFASYLYKTYKPERVCTWDSMRFDNKFMRNEREYHYCIGILNKDNVNTNKILKSDNWMFQMGDCELF